MRVEELKSEKELGDLLKQVPLRPFLQSWAWGEFQKSYGRKIWRLGAYDGERLVGAITLIRHVLMFGQSYLYAPHGPAALNVAAAEALAEAAKKTGRENGAMFVKLNPPMNDYPEKLFAGYRYGATLQPRNTLVLDLKPSEDELLAAMHQKTRYNIRLAQKHGVTVRWSKTDSDLAMFLKLMKETAQRQGITNHPDEYYRLMFAEMCRAGLAELGVAEMGGEVLAVNMVFWYQDLAIFPHGASTDAHKEVMAPYLLQWETIRRAKEKGMTAYDFRGIAPENRPMHKLAGVTRFKIGFGGARKIYPRAQDAVLQKTWWLVFRLAKKARGRVEEQD